MGFRVTSLFDAANRRTAIVDARGNRYSFGFSKADERRTTTDPLGRVQSTIFDGASQPVVRLDARENEGLAWLVGSDFVDGAIEVELRGRDVPNQSFVGIAFRGVDDKKYEAVYFRPFNFRTPDPARAVHAVQYVSSPDFPWHRLREEHPGVYEKAVSPVPDPNDWFRARIEVKGQSIKAFVNGAATPSLTVTGLSEPVHGAVGLFVGNESPGDFANLKIIPA